MGVKRQGEERSRRKRLRKQHVEKKGGKARSSFAGL